MDLVLFERLQVSLGVGQQSTLRPRIKGMNILRRLQIIAGVIAASAAAGAGAGLLVAGVILATKLGDVRPTTVWELLKLGSQTGAALGVLLGPPAIFGLLRRVPLNRLARDAFFGATYGGVIGFLISTAFRQPRPAIALILSGSLAGLGLATARLWARFREARNSSSVPAAG